MKTFELTYLCVEHFLPELYKKIRKQLLDVAGSYPYRLELLDAGGRRSNYTIGIPADITITDLYRKTKLQKNLKLGIDSETIELIYRRRSNIKNIIIDDITHSLLPDTSFDCVVAVEVLEHIEEDALFIQEVHRVLKPGGVFIMSTPNGDHLLRYGPAWKENPDNKRLYTREQLSSLLSPRFKIVKIEYAVKASRWHAFGIRHFSFKRPLVTILAMIGNFINSIESRGDTVKYQAHETRHLIAVAKKSN